MNSFYNIFRKFAFALDPERVHINSLKWASRCPFFISSLLSETVKDSRLNIRLGDLSWPLPVGLAAGLDKNGEAIDFFTRLPFGGIEVGSVTPWPQQGNPSPRLFRLAKEHSLLNRMGFNNVGSDQVLDNITRTCRHGKILGVNIGKNKNTPEEKAPDDYRILYQKFESIADYLVINVSSPNTPGLSAFQRSEELGRILKALEDIRSKTPLFVKVSPDLSFDLLKGIVETVKDYNLQGIVATNTTVMPERGKGGISGRLLKEKAVQVREMLLGHLKETPQIDLIGVGGIDGFEDVLRFWKKGGRVVQIYTSFIYQGPQILMDIYSEVQGLLDKTGVADVNELLEDDGYALRF